MTMCLRFIIHTKQFLTAGCKDVLLQMTDKLDIVLDWRSIELGHLSITSYLSVPNLMNTCN